MVSRLANKLKDKGEDVSIILFDTSNQVYRVNSDIRIADINVHTCNKIIRKLRQIRQVRNFIKTEKPDILFCYIVTTLPFGVLANLGLKRKCKIVGTERTNPRCMKQIHRIIVQMFLPFCDGFIFQTSGVKSWYPRRIQDEGAVIGNIAPTVDIRRDQTQVIKHGVCSAGRLHTDKDFETLIYAFKLVVDEFPDATLHIYGDGPLKDSLADLAKKIGIAKNIIFEGFTKNILDEMKKYEVFAFSSRAEGMPNSLIEAMASGLACVSSDCDYGPSDLITDGIDGYLVEVGNTEMMADRILHLIDNEELRKNMGKNAIKIQERFSEENIVGAYLDYAQKLVWGKENKYGSDKIWD